MQLAQGFRFHPSPQILIKHYLHKKIVKEELPEVILTKELYGSNSFSPWELLDCSSSKNEELYYFTLIKKKYGGKNIDRVTKDGTWKKDGTDPVKDNSNNKVIGYLTSLTLKLDEHKFDKNHIAKQWNWTMHEYSMKDADCENEYWVVCGIKRGRSTSDSKEKSKPASLKRSSHVIYDVDNLSDNNIKRPCVSAGVATTLQQDEGFSVLLQHDDAGFLLLQHDQQLQEACNNEGELASTSYNENSVSWTQPSMIDASMATSNQDTLYEDIDVEALMLQIDEFKETEEGEAKHEDLKPQQCAADMSTTESSSMYAGDSGMQLGYDDSSAELTAEDYSYFSPLLRV